MCKKIEALSNFNIIIMRYMYTHETFVYFRHNQRKMLKMKNKQGSFRFKRKSNNLRIITADHCTKHIIAIMSLNSNELKNNL